MVIIVIQKHIGTLDKMELLVEQKQHKIIQMVMEWVTFIMHHQLVF